jgi:hypothetical protein
MAAVARPRGLARQHDDRRLGRLQRLLLAQGRRLRAFFFLAVAILEALPAAAPTAPRLSGRWGGVM